MDFPWSWVFKERTEVSKYVLIQRTTIRFDTTIIPVLKALLNFVM